MAVRNEEKKYEKNGSVNSKDRREGGEVLQTPEQRFSCSSQGNNNGVGVTLQPMKDVLFLRVVVKNLENKKLRKKKSEVIKDLFFYLAHGNYLEGCCQSLTDISFNYFK